jgi:hypothetical protein
VLLNLLDYFDPKQQYPSFPPFVTFSTEKQSQIYLVLKMGKS